MKGQPLPGQGTPDTGLYGPWRATVISVADDGSSIDIVIPRLTGPGRLVTNCESAVFDPPLEPSARVWVWPIEGNRDLWMIGSRRA